MYKYVTIKCSIMGNLKEDYQKIISNYSKKGYNLVSMIPLYLGTKIPSQYDLIFKKEKE